MNKVDSCHMLYMVHTLVPLLVTTLYKGHHPTMQWPKLISQTILNMFRFHSLRSMTPISGQPRRVIWEGDIIIMTGLLHMIIES